MPHRDCNLIHRVTIRSDVSLITEEEMLARRLEYWKIGAESVYNNIKGR